VTLPEGEESIISTHHLYVFLRLHNILYERLKIAGEICEAVGGELTPVRESS
jgi:hypothetical protein